MPTVRASAGGRPHGRPIREPHAKDCTQSGSHPRADRSAAPGATLRSRRPDRLIDDRGTTVVGTLAGTGNAPGTDLPARTGCRGEAVGDLRGPVFGPGVVLLVIATAAVGSGLLGWDGGSLAGAREVAGKVFAFVVAVQAMMVMVLVPGAVAPALAGERDRKTLDAVLASGFTSAEVVLGALGAGLVRSLGGPAAVLPVMIVMVPLAGIDPRLVLLAVAGLAATAFVLGAISILVSIVAATPAGPSSARSR